MSIQNLTVGLQMVPSFAQSKPQNKVHPKYAGPSDDPHFIPSSPIMERQVLSSELEFALKQSCNALLPHLRAARSSSGNQARAPPPPPEHLILGSSKDIPDETTMDSRRLSSFLMDDAQVRVAAIMQRPRTEVYTTDMSDLIEIDNDSNSSRQNAASSVGSASSRSMSGSLPTNGTSVLPTPNEPTFKAKDYLSINTVAVASSQGEPSPKLLNSPMSASFQTNFSRHFSTAGNLLSPVSAAFEDVLRPKSVTQQYLDDDEDDEDELHSEGNEEERDAGWWQSVGIGRRSSGYQELSNGPSEGVNDDFSGNAKAWRSRSNSEGSIYSIIEEPAVPATVIDATGNTHVMTADEEAERRRVLQAAVLAKMTGAAGATKMPLSPTSPTSATAPKDFSAGPRVFESTAYTGATVLKASPLPTSNTRSASGGLARSPSLFRKLSSRIGRRKS